MTKVPAHWAHDPTTYERLMKARRPIVAPQAPVKAPNAVVRALRWLDEPKSFRLSPVTIAIALMLCVFAGRLIEQVAR